MYYNPYLQQQPYDPMYRQQQYIQQPVMQQNAAQQQIPVMPAQMPVTNQDDRIWVQGESSAQAYLVAPNSFVRLWDSTAQVFYEKRADASGKPSMTIYNYSLRGSEPSIEEKNVVQPIVDYTEQIEALKTKIEALEERMDLYNAEQYENESYDHDSGVYEVQEQFPRRPKGRSPKTGSTRKD